MATARSDRTRNEARILVAAARLLASNPTASMQAVADAAGVARLTVYRRYPDRDALVTALRTAVDAELDRALDGVPAWGGPDVLVALVRALADVAVRYPIALLRYAPVPGGPPPADARIVGLLRAGQHAGVLRSDLPAETLNLALFGVLSAVLAADETVDGDTAAATVLALLFPGFTSA